MFDKTIKGIGFLLDIGRVVSGAVITQHSPVHIAVFGGLPDDIT